MKTIDKYYEKLSSYTQKVAIIYKDQSYTYQDLTDNVLIIQNSIKAKGVLPGEICVIHSDFSFQSISLFFSLALNSNIIVPFSVDTDLDLDSRVQQANADWIFKFDDKNLVYKKLNNNKNEKNHLLNDLIDNSLSGLILFSSGSTGKPKVMLHNLNALIDTYNEKKEKSLNLIAFLLFDHIGGLNTLLNTLAVGGTIIIPVSRIPDHICILIEKYNVNVLPCSPTFLNLLLISQCYENYNLSSLRLITYGTEPMPEALLIKLKNKFNKVKFIQTFGTSETGIIKTLSKSSNSTLLKFDDINHEYKIVDGELWLKSNTQILGYLNYSNESFTDDGWFKTKDLVEQLDDGYIKIVGRISDIINVGGEKVFPIEVESVICELPQIADCMVKGILNSITGQAVVAEIVLHEGYNQDVEKNIIKKHCISKLDKYKVPVKYIFVNSLHHSNRFKKIRT